MKAWLVYVEEPCVDRVELIWDVVWAETRGKAKQASIFWSGPSEHYEWTEIKARRIPALDGKRENEVTTAEAIQAGLPITCLRCHRVLTMADVEAGHVVGFGPYVALCRPCADQRQEERMREVLAVAAR